MERPTATQVAAESVVEEDVVERNGHLYPAKTARGERVQPTDQPEVAKSPGTGRSDETNGQCRLFAPELPDPKCCTGEYGFDAQKVQDICGHSLYLGESAHFSCGYWFHGDEGRPVPFRIAMAQEPTVKEAVDTHLRKLAKTGTGTPTSEAVPGVPDAVWVHHNEYHWAFIPGWSRVRQLAWMDDSCSNDAMPKVIAGLREAKEPPKGAPRQGLIPQSRS